MFFSLGQFHSWHFTIRGWRGGAQRTEGRTELPFATIPLLFGIQQLTEGVIWLTFSHDAPLLKQTMTYLYSGFSHVLWPIYVPFAMGVMEAVPWRKKAILAFEVAGVAVGLYLLYYMVTLPMVAEVVGRHIVYLSPHFYLIPVMVLYLAATCVSCFFSESRVREALWRVGVVVFHCVIRRSLHGLGFDLVLFRGDPESSDLSSPEIQRSRRVPKELEFPPALASRRLTWLGNRDGLERRSLAYPREV